MMLLAIGCGSTPDGDIRVTSPTGTAGVPGDGEVSSREPAEEGDGEPVTAGADLESIARGTLTVALEEGRRTYEEGDGYTFVGFGGCQDGAFDFGVVIRADGADLPEIGVTVRVEQTLTGVEGTYEDSALELSLTEYETTILDGSATVRLSDRIPGNIGGSMLVDIIGETSNGFDVVGSFPFARGC